MIGWIIAGLLGMAVAGKALDSALSDDSKDQTDDSDKKELTESEFKDLLVWEALVNCDEYLLKYRQEYLSSCYDYYELHQTSHSHVDWTQYRADPEMQSRIESYRDRINSALDGSSYSSIYYVTDSSAYRFVKDVVNDYYECKRDTWSYAYGLQRAFESTTATEKRKQEEDE